VVRTIDGVLKAAREKGVPVVYLQTGCKPDLSNGGGWTLRAGSLIESLRA
jgi:hypothetical protein